MKVNFQNLIYSLQGVQKQNRYVTPSFGRNNSLSSLDNDVFEKNDSYENPKSKEARKVISSEKKANVETVKPWAARLKSDATTAETIFTSRMMNVFRDTCEFYDKSFYNFPEDGKRLGSLELCTKSMHSIIEKMLGNGYESEAAAREDIQDVIRGRIVLEHGSREEGDKICKQIADAVKAHKLEVVEVTHYYSDESEKYISNRMFKNLQKAVAGEYGKGSCKFTEIEKLSGYNGLHLIFKIDDEFSAELQIMGPEVEKLKDVEDVFYKLRHSKDVDKKYYEIRDKYKTLNQKAKNRLEAYSREAYVAQRQKELGTYQGDRTKKYTPLDPKYNLPKIFDFNYIASL